MCQIAVSPLASQLQSAKLAVGHQRGDPRATVNLSPELIELMTEVFDSFDLDKSGDVEVDEFKRYLETYGSEVADEDVERIIKLFDKDNSGRLNLNEFLVYSEEQLK